MKPIRFIIALMTVLFVALCGLFCTSTRLTYEEINKKYPTMRISDPSVVAYFFPFDIWVYGFTIYNSVFMFENMVDAEAFANRTCVLEHEYVHTVQYKDGWFFYRYFSFYLTVPWSSWSINDNRGNPLEAEASVQDYQCPRTKRIISYP